DQEKVSFDRIRINGPNPKKDSVAPERGSAPNGEHPGGTKRKLIKEITTPSGYVIPTHLLAKPGDTEAQKQMKRRKLEALKKEQREQKSEEEAQERQSS